MVIFLSGDNLFLATVMETPPEGMEMFSWLAGHEEGPAAE